VFGFITALLNIIVSATPQALADRRKAQERELGARLFHLYLSAYDIADRGDYIIETLKLTRSVMNSPNPEARSWWTSRLEDLLESQSHSILVFRKAAFECGIGMAALDPETFRKIERYIFRKLRRIDDLRAALHGHRFPLESPQVSLDEPYATSMDSAVISLFELLDTVPQWDGEVDLAAELNQPAVAMIEAYLNDLHPERDLAEIRQLLRTLRKALDENFKVGEILLEISRFRLEDGSFMSPSWKRPAPAL
jgi:hypothetical protein